MIWKELIFERMDLAWLWAVIPLMLIVFLYDGARIRRLLKQIGDHSLVSRMLGKAPTWRRRVRRLLWLLALSCMILAAMRPRAGLKSQQLQHVGIDVAVVLDVSRSMLVPDVPPNRLKAAIADISGLLSKLRGGRVALIPVAGVGFVQCPLTSDHEVIRQYLADLDVQDMPVPGTNLSHALDVAMNALGVKPETTIGENTVEMVTRYEGAKYKAIVLLTDGEDFGQNIDEALERVKQSGIPIFSVGVGTPSGKPVPVFDELGNQTGVQKDEEGKPVFSGLNEDLLVQIAQETGGSFHSLSQGSVVAPIFGQIDRMEKREYESQIRKLREDRFAVPLWIALFLLLMEWLISEYPRKRRMKTGSLAAIFFLISGCSLEEAPFVVENSHVNTALEALEEGQGVRALEEIQIARSELPDQPKLDLDEGLALLEMGEYPDAIRKFERALERMPAEHRARTLYALGLGHALSGLAQERQAASLAEIEGEDGSEAAAESLTSWRRARDLFEEVLNKNPKHEEARRGLEAALYRTDPPCSMRDSEGEPDTPPASPRPFPIQEDATEATLSSLLCPDDTDRFSLTLPPRNRLFAELDGENEQGKAMLRVQNLPTSEGTIVENRIVGFVSEKKENPIFNIEHAQVLEGEVPYELKVELIPSCKDLDAEFPSDDTPGSASRVEDLVEAPLRLCPGERDYFAVEVLPGYSLLTLVDVNDPQQPAQGEEAKPLGRGPRVPGQPEDKAPRVRILDLGMKVRAQGFGGGGRTMAVLPEPPADGYFVEISAPEAAPALETPYRLSILRIPPCPEGNLDDKIAAAQQIPPNDNADQATPMQPGGLGLGRICAADIDWYSFQADEEKPTAVEVLFDRSQSSLEVDGFHGEDLDGDSIPAAATASGAIFEIPILEEAEAPRVRIRGEQSVGEGFYLIRHISQPPSDPSEGNENQQDPDQQDQEEEENQDPNQDEKKPQEQAGQDQQQQPKPKPSALEQLLQDMDQNPRNLEADEAARKAQGTIVLPLRDW